MSVLIILTEAVLLFYGTQLFPLGGKLDKLRFICFGLIIFSSFFLSPKFKLRTPKWLDFVALVILFLAYVSCFYSFDPQLTFLRSTANLLMYIAIFWILWFSCKNSLRVQHYVYALLFVWIIFYGVNIIFLFLRPQDSFQIHEWELSSVYQRFNGITGNPNTISLFSTIILPLVIWNFGKRKSLLNLFFLVSVVFSFFYSFSRDAIICSIVGSSIYFYLSTKGHRIFIIIYAVFAIVFTITYAELFKFFLPAGLIRTDNLMFLGGRIEAWQAALELIRQHPWRGYGFGLEDFLFEKFHYVFEIHAGGMVHNSFLGFALQIGWIAPIVFYSALLIFLTTSFRKLLKLDSQFQSLMNALYASIVSGVLISLFESWIYSAGGILSFPFFIFIMFLLRLLDFEKNMVKPSSLQSNLEYVSG